MLFLNVVSRFHSSSGFFPASRTSSQTFVRFHMESHQHAQRATVWAGGGLDQSGDRGRSRAPEHQRESSAPHEPKSEGRNSFSSFVDRNKHR